MRIVPSPFSCSTAKQATCSCGKESALHCSCDKAATENSVSGPRCSCRARPAGECTCERASTENTNPIAVGVSACACGVRPAGRCFIFFVAIAMFIYLPGRERGRNEQGRALGAACEKKDLARQCKLTIVINNLDACTCEKATDGKFNPSEFETDFTTKK